MPYFRSKNVKKQRMIQFFNKLMFWKKKESKRTAQVFVSGFPLKKYEVTFNYGRKLNVYAHSFSESKDIAEALIRKKYPTMQFRVITTKEVIANKKK
jgi:hypothetical protein